MTTLSAQWKCFTAAVALSAPSLCLAGRPVHHDLSLSELTHRSTLIAVVTRAAADTIEQGTHGCKSSALHLVVVAIIKSSPGIEIGPGKTIDVRQDVTSYRDCVYRQGWKTTGVSFAAYRYTPSVPDATLDERFIVFLEPSDRGFQLTTDLSVEPVATMTAIKRLLNDQP